jgi:hypothetical protein
MDAKEKAAVANNAIPLTSPYRNTAISSHHTSVMPPIICKDRELQRILGKQQLKTGQVHSPLWPPVPTMPTPYSLHKFPRGISAFDLPIASSLDATLVQQLLISAKPSSYRTSHAFSPWSPGASIKHIRLCYKHSSTHQMI